MKKATTLLAVVVLFGAYQPIEADEIVGTNGAFPQPFAPVTTVTFNAGASDNGLTTLVLDSQGSTTQTAGIWTLTAQGGSNVSLLGTVLDESGAQVALTGTSLQFGRDNGPGASILGALGASGNLQYSWTATAAFAGFNYQPNTQYNLSFHIDGANGLLQDLSGVTPTFQAQFVDGAGNPLTISDGTTALNLLNVLGAGVSSGDVTMTFDTGSVVPTGPVGVRFLGSATVNSVASPLMDNNMAEVSNMTLDAQPIPEPSAALLVMVCGVCVMFRRPRLLRTA
jgi:hypothetical protein